ncbi:hypothetical protein CRE_21412 [Caenorhabditis remanei]|uniref:BTB domain-containing protein n=1 Tax=Caenorhabditis remanei TaxID=31234 RepID=E3MUT2_CAERE|nr:hypothetical protein CRE_21412 [Caenorhabditis remanei]
MSDSEMSDEEMSDEEISDEEISDEDISDEEISDEKMSDEVVKAKQEFTIRHSFEKPLEMKKDEVISGNVENHLGIPWKLDLENTEEDELTINLNCLKPDCASGWIIDACVRVNLINATKKKKLDACEVEFTHLDPSDALYDIGKDIVKENLIDGNVVVEVTVSIGKQKTFKHLLRNFTSAEAVEKSDVTLVAKGVKFHVVKMDSVCFMTFNFDYHLRAVATYIEAKVNKEKCLYGNSMNVFHLIERLLDFYQHDLILSRNLYLATHCEYFKSMFSGKFAEKKKQEIELKDVDPYHLQCFLELIYGELPINGKELNISGLFALVDMFIADSARRRCIKYLEKAKKLSLSEKLELSFEYRLEDLKPMFLAEIKTADQLEEVLPDDPEELDHDLLAALMVKSMELHKTRTAPIFKPKRAPKRKLDD